MGENLILVTSCHAHELFSEKVLKLVKIFLGESLIVHKKNMKRHKAKGKPCDYIWPFSFMYEITVS